jgi:alpha-L-rhamnosidase
LVLVLPDLAPSMSWVGINCSSWVKSIVSRPILGETGIAQRMSTRARIVKDAFEREFITPSGRVAYNDQTSYALAILYDLLPEQHLEAARRYLKASIERAGGRIGTGFIGTPALLPALIKIGEPELAARLFLQEEVPGWLFQVKMGATSIWERWDSLRADGSINGEEMNSYNHYAYGAVCQWLFESVAGFRPDPENPGFSTSYSSPPSSPSCPPFLPITTGRRDGSKLAGA